MTLRGIGRRIGARFGFRLGLAAILTVGLGPAVGIGLAVRVVLLEPLPYDEPDRLALVGHRTDGARWGPTVSLAQLERVREAATSAAEIGYLSREYQTNVMVGRRHSITAVLASAEMGSVLGVPLAAGRWFAIEDEGPLPARPVLISHALAVQLFGSAEAAVGTNAEVDGSVRPIVGVLAEGFRFWLGPDANVSPDIHVIVPVGIDRTRGATDLRHIFRGVVRLTPGADLSSLAADLTGAQAALARQRPGDFAEGYALEPRSLHREVTAPVRPALVALAVAGGLLVIVTVGNAATLLGSLVVRHRTAFLTKRALGATPGRLRTEVLAESSAIFILAALGTGLLAQTLVQLGVGLEILPRREEIARAGAWLPAMVATGLALVLASIPGLLALPTDASLAGLRGRPGVAGRRAMIVMLGVEGALAGLLLVSAILTTRSFAALSRIDLGYDPDRVITIQLDLDTDRFPQAPDRARVLQTVIRDVGALPGVTAVGAVNILPLDGMTHGGSYAVEGMSEEQSARTHAEFRTTTPGFLEALGVDVVAGRLLNWTDVDLAVANVVVDERLAERHWPPADAVGRRIRLTGMNGGRQWATIVGVVRHTRFTHVRDAESTQIYEPFSLWPRTERVALAARVTDERHTLRTVQQALVRADLTGPPFGARRLRALVDEQAAVERVTSRLLALTAGATLFLCLMGVYGLTAYVVQASYREYGLRSALGASPARLFRTVTADIVLAVGFGAVVGLTGSIWATRAVQGLLYGVSGATVSLLGASLVAMVGLAVPLALIPARRAAFANPAVLLREQDTR